MNILEQETRQCKDHQILTFPNKIHPTALVAAGAELGLNVSVGPFSIIGEHVKIGAGTVIGPHVVIEGWTSIGERNQIGTGTIIGNPPQDLKFRGEESYVLIGDDNIIREYVTINRGTEGGGLITKIGNNNVIMTSVHVAHDVNIHNNVIISNGVGLAGHVIVEDWVTLGGLSGIHQFTQIGFMAIVGKMSAISKDIPPFFLVNGNPAKLYGINIERLRRNKYPIGTRMLLQRAYKILVRSGMKLEDAIKKVEQELPSNPEIDIILQFIRRSNRGIYR